jgi:hypothetical protein
MKQFLLLVWMTMFLTASPAWAQRMQPGTSAAGSKSFRVSGTISPGGCSVSATNLVLTVGQKRIAELSTSVQGTPLPAASGALTVLCAGNTQIGFSVKDNQAASVDMLTTNGSIPLQLNDMSNNVYCTSSCARQTAFGLGMTQMNGQNSSIGVYTLTASNLVVDGVAANVQMLSIVSNSYVLAGTAAPSLMLNSQMDTSSYVTWIKSAAPAVGKAFTVKFIATSTINSQANIPQTKTNLNGNTVINFYYL